MKILLCCEFFHPSVGGVQEVMKQIGERFVTLGNSVTVATSALDSRRQNEYRGIEISEFDVSGNIVSGFRGTDVERYREFVASGDFDVILIKAAQQWTFDALWEVIDSIDAAKVFIPCGFSGLYLEEYKEYFEKIGGVLARFNALIFYASDYRDINFCRNLGLSNLFVVSNAADEREFEHADEGDIRTKLGIIGFDYVLLSVGSPAIQKGMRDLASAFLSLQLKGKSAVLVLNSDWRNCSSNETKIPGTATQEILRLIRLIAEKLRAMASLTRHGRFREVFRFAKAFAFEFYRDSWLTFLKKGSIGHSIYKANRLGDRHIITTNLERSELIQLYKAADLFVFASWVEYSPLVLFEAVAAGTRFLSVDAGNSEEIAEWTGGGSICKGNRVPSGFVKIDRATFANRISSELSELGSGRSHLNVKKYFWAEISEKYLLILKTAIENHRSK